VPERTCSVSWCERKHHANGLCRTHDLRRRNGLDLETPLRQYERSGVCKVEGCDKPRSMSADYCSMHRMRVARTGEPGDAAALKLPRTRTAGLPRLKRATNGSPQWNDPGYRREYRLQLDYHLTHDDLAAMIEAQSNGCAICRSVLVSGDYREKREFAVDHEAASGKVRGLLCHACNKGIGFFRDDPELLASAIAYLNRAVT
jgi:Recombination endonuclease VII